MRTNEYKLDFDLNFVVADAAFDLYTKIDEWHISDLSSCNYCLYLQNEMVSSALFNYLLFLNFIFIFQL